MSIWTDFGFRENPYSTKAIPPTAEGAELLVGREREARKLHRLITSSDTHPTVEGDNGVGKTSLVQVTAFAAKRAAETGRTGQVHLPLAEVFQVTNDVRTEAFRRQVCFAVVQGFSEHRETLVGAGYAVPPMGDLLRWMNDPVFRAGGLTTPVGGASRGATPNTSAGFADDGFERMVFAWLRTCFPSPEAGGFICVLDNLELLESSAYARRFLEEIRDTLLTVPGLRWVLCGARGVVRGVVASPRLNGVLSAPLEIAAVAPKHVPEVISRRIDAYVVADDPFLPVDPDGFARIYKVLNRNLRESLKLCQTFAFEFDDEPIRPKTHEERMALLNRWLADQGMSYQRAANNLGPRTWAVFDQLVAAGGVCATSDWERFRLVSKDVFRKHIRSLERSNLVSTAADQVDRRKRVVRITGTGYLVSHSRVGRAAAGRAIG